MCLQANHLTLVILKQNADALAMVNAPNSLQKSQNSPQLAICREGGE